MNSKDEDIQKVLLMGRNGAGKTSMRSIIFANYLAKDTYRIAYTVEVNHSRVRFLGNLVLNLWDCGGQDKFMEQYFQSQRDQIFTSVGVLIYVFEVTSRDWEKDLKYYEDCLKALSELSASANIFCLIHKMDLVAEKDREKEFAKKSKEIVARSHGFKPECYKTSIWDETLFQAWSNIVHVLIPNSKSLEKQLAQFSLFTGADETVLFERHTFLVISHTDVKGHVDSHRFEKISNIIKQFKLSCMKTNYAF